MRPGEAAQPPAKPSRPLDIRTVETTPRERELTDLLIEARNREMHVRVDDVASSSIVCTQSRSRDRRSV